MANIRSVKGPMSAEEVAEQRVSCNQFHNDRNHYALPEDMTKEGILKSCVIVEFKIGERIGKILSVGIFTLIFFLVTVLYNNDMSIVSPIHGSTEVV